MKPKAGIITAVNKVTIPAAAAMRRPLLRLLLESAHEIPQIKINKPAKIG